MWRTKKPAFRGFLFLVFFFPPSLRAQEEHIFSMAAFDPRKNETF
jgi:hypothetical protein